MHLIEHNDVPCRCCAQLLGVARPIDGGTIKDLHDSFSLCQYCGEVSVFVVSRGQVALREPTLRELRYFNKTFGGFARDHARTRINESRS